MEVLCTASGWRSHLEAVEQVVYLSLWNKMQFDVVKPLSLEAIDVDLWAEKVHSGTFSSSIEFSEQQLNARGCRSEKG